MQRSRRKGKNSGRKRQRELLALLISGHNQKENARQLRISPVAFRSRVYRLKRKLGAGDLCQLVHYGHCLGLITTEDYPPKRNKCDVIL